MDNSIASSIIDEYAGNDTPKDAPETGSTPTSAPPASSIGASMVDEMLKKQEVEDRLAIKENAAVDAARQAEAVRLGKQFSVPSSTAYNQIEELRRRQTELAMEEKRQNYPAWSSVLSDHDLGPIAQDPANAADLQFIEDKFGVLKGPQPSYWSDLKGSYQGYMQSESTKTFADASDNLGNVKQGNRFRAEIVDPTGFRKHMEKQRDSALQDMAYRQEELNKIPQRPEMQEYNNAQGVMAKLAVLARNPSIILQTLAQSAVPMTPAVVAGAVGTLLGGPAGTISATMAAEGRTEYGSRLVSGLQQFGADLSNPESVKRVWAAHGKEISDMATKGALIVAGVDAATAGLVSKVGGLPLRMLTKEVLGTTLDATGGFTGDVLAQLATQDKVDLGSSILEGAAEIPGGITNTAAGAIREHIDARAEAAHKELVTLGDRIRASKTVQTSPETILAHAQAIDDGGHGPSMSASAEALHKLFQSENFTPEMVASAFPEVAQALNEAAGTNAEVPLPAKTVVQLAQFPGFTALADEIRTAPDMPTAKEAREQGADLEQTIADMSEEDKRAAVRASVEAEAAKAIAATGQDPKAAATMAKVHASVLMNLAEKNGMNLEDLVNQYKLEITGNQSTDTTTDGTTLTQNPAYGEPAVRIGDQVFKASDYFPNWEKGTRENGAMSIEEDMAIADWGHKELLDNARKALGAEAVDAALEANPEGVLGHTNSAGEFKSLTEVPRSETFYQTKAATSTPEFKTWFGDSKVVDEQGAPLVVYHGAPDTKGPLGEKGFQTPKERYGLEDPNRAFFFTDTYRKAASYADARRAFDYQNADPGVLATYLSLKNPKIIDWGGKPWKGTADAIAAAKAEGHDGVIIRNVKDYYTGNDKKTAKPGSVYVAFDPTQIKSATGNRGTFDPNNPNILYQSDPNAATHNLMMVANRGERVTASTAEISKEEEASIKAASKAVGLPEEDIRDQVIKHKVAHPPEQGWAPLVFKKVKKEEGDGGKVKYTYEYVEVPYAFNTIAGSGSLEPGTPEYKARVEAVGKAMSEEVRTILRRALAGDKNAQNILKQAGWYKAMRSRLRQEFGGLGDLFADLLGATSPNTPVRENWKNAIDSLRRASRGDFDELIGKWVDWADNVERLENDLRAWVNQKIQEFQDTAPERQARMDEAVARRAEARKAYKAEQKKLGRIAPEAEKDDAYKAIGVEEIAALRNEAAAFTKKALIEGDEYQQKLAELRAAREEIENLLPTKENDAKYGFNGRNVANAMIALWRVVKNEEPIVARGGTKPKAINFSGNLIGFRNRATIDVWAARMLQRLAGFLRIPSMAEGGVSGNMREDGTTTLQFGFGQDAFSDATRRIRADAEMSQDQTLANINDDDLQALVWFIEKELWTVNNWTSVAGEGGSFELEANLTGPADQARVTELRRIIDSNAEINQANKVLADTKGPAAAQAILDDPNASEADKKKAAKKLASLEAAKVKARQTLEDVAKRKEDARHELAAMERTVDRFVGGLSIQMSQDTQGVDYVPTDADMAMLGNRMRTAIYESDNGATVLASKALSTEGRYGNVERSIDLEVIARQGYDANKLWLQMLREAQRTRQDSTFLSRVLRDGEAYDPLRHRPGVEIYFQDAAARGQLEQVLADLAKEGVKFLTVIVDGRRMPGYVEGEMPPAVGVRLQYVPEFEQRYGTEQLSGLDDAALAQRIEAEKKRLEDLAARVAANVPGVSFAGQFWYETQVAFASEYQEKIDALTAGQSQGKPGAPGAPVWSGQRIREGLENADRHVRETAGGQSGGQPGDLLGRDAQGVGSDGNQTLYQSGSERPGDGAGRYSGGGLAPLAGAPVIEGATGPDPGLVSVAERYAKDNGIPLRRQANYVKVDVELARRIAAAYEAMPNAPQDPQVKAAYADLIRQTRAQYDALIAAGYKFTFFDGKTDPYAGNPWNAMRDLRANKRMAVYGTYDGFGTEGITANATEDNPMLADTGLRWKDQAGVEHPVLANDLFRAVHDAFGHGLEGAGFRGQGEENAWQAHARLFTGPAVGALTSETRGQNSWLNYGPYGEQNQKAKVEDTVFAENKAGLMPPWTWEEGRAADEAPETGPSSSKTTLNQKGQSSQTFARGSISFTTARNKFTMTLTGRADLSTFMHEAGHYYLEVIQDLVAKGKASPELVADLEKIRAWMGLKPGEAIEVRHHEMFARGFEAYLMEGRAPSVELQGAFNRLRAWMVFIYKRLSALNVDLTDEVRGVFDRLLASDAAIAEARTNIGWGKPLPKEALYLSDEEYDRYVEAWNKANEEQQREVDARLMLEAAREAQEQWKNERRQVFDEEKGKIEQSRGWRAWKLLSEGVGLEGEAPGRTSLKIDPVSVPPGWIRDAVGMTEEGGLPIDTVAEILGFDSGEQMLSLIAGSREAMKSLPADVKKIMQARHGDLDATALADLATAAVQSDKTHEVLLTEYRAMAEKAGIGGAPKGMLEWMAGQAKQKVLALTRRQLDPVRWRRAQLKAAAESAKAAAKGDMTTAAIKKRQQMMAAVMERATLQADKRIETIRKKLMPFTKNDRRAKLGKAGDLYLDAIDEILEGIQLKNISAASVQKLDRLAKLVEEADAKGEPLQLPDKVRAMLGKKHFADMTLEELEGVHDTVMNIWHLAKTKNELRARAETREMENVLTEMEANAQAAMGDPKVRDGFVKSKLDRYTSLIRWGRAQLVKMEFLFGWLDGKPAGGLMHRYIYQPLADANREEYKILGRLNRDLYSRLRDMPREQKARWNRKITFMGEEANGATIISAALNLGNASNKQKLLEGYGWNEQRLMAEINAFMTKADWDIVQHIWDQIDTLWPQIEETTRLATGLRPEKVAGTPVATPFGTYAGGYYPVVYDPDRTEKQFKNQQSAEGLFSNNFVRPTLGDGFTKARVDYAAPILLDLSVISRHLSEVVHFVTHYEAVTQADKITRHPRFQKLVKGHMGNEFYREIRPWLQDIARAQDSPAVTNREILSKGAKYIRGGMSISQMGYNLFTGMKQLFGVVTTLDAVGPTYWMSGLQKSWLSPNAAENWRFALKESAELEPLITSFDRDIKMINDTYAKSLAGGVVDAAVKYAFAHIGYFQLAVNVAAWHGAYEQALGKGLDHEAAVKEADAVVRQTQSSGAIKDLSAVQRGSEASRMVSLFYSFFSVLYNRLEDINRQTKSIGDVPRAARRIAVLVFMSAMIDETTKRLWSAGGGDDGKDDDKNGFMLSVLLKSADMMIGSVPLIRGFLSAEYMFGNGFKPEAAPVWRVGEDVFRAAAGIKHLVTKGEMSAGEAKAALRSVSVATRLPLYGAANSVMSIYELASEMLGGNVKK